MKNIFLAITFFFLIGILSCGKNEETKTDVSSKIEDVNKTSPRDTISKNGSISNTENTKPIRILPDSFDNNFPFYKNAVISPSSKKEEGNLILESDDNIKAVSDFYKSEMPNHGFKAVSGNDIVMTNKGGIMTYTKDGKKYELTFRYSDSASKTILVVNIVK